MMAVIGASVGFVITKETRIESFDDVDKHANGAFLDRRVDIRTVVGPCVIWPIAEH